MAAKAPTRLRPTAVKTWQIPGIEGTFTQDPLTFFEKNEFIALIARVIDLALASGFDLEALIQMFAIARSEATDEIGEDAPSMSRMVSVFTTLFSLTPELLEEAYLIFLSVPRKDWVEVREGIRRIDDDTGFGILETFFVQNTKALSDFLPRWRAQFTKLAAIQPTTTTPTPAKESSEA